MREGGVPEDDEEAVDPTHAPVSPYLRPEPPERRSVIPPSKETFVFPSGRAARPVEEYLMPTGPSEEAPDGGEGAGSVSDQKPGAWPQRDPGGVGGFDGDDGSRRIWGLPPWAIWVGLGVILLVIGFVVFGGGASNGPRPNETVTASPNGPTVPSYFDDGIAPDEYPHAAESRGEGFPESLTMADWVWEKVSPEWAIVLVSGWSFGDTESEETPAPVVYLVSPEGVYFELTELPSNVANGATLVSWHEENRTARIIWNQGTRGGMLHLDTGEVEDTSFQMTSGRTKEVQFIAADASGREVWLAWALDFTETRYFAWTSEGGWERILSGQDDLYMEWAVDPANGDGSALALQIYTLADSLVASERSLPPGTPNFVVFSIKDNESTRYQPAFGPEPNCWFTGWIDLVSVGFSCWSDDEGTQTDYRVAVDGSGTVVPYQVEVPWFNDLSGQEVVRQPDGPLELTVDSESGTVTGVRLVGDDGPVEIADSSQFGDGVAVRSLDEIAPGVYRLVTWDRIVIGIDTETGTIAPMLVAQPEPPYLIRSYVFFGEETPSGVGLYWGD